MDKQARLPPALAALHNFIRKHDPDDIADFDDNIDNPEPGTCVERPAAADEGELSAGPQRQWRGGSAMTGGVGLHEKCGYSIRQNFRGMGLTLSNELRFQVSVDEIILFTIP